MLVLSSTAFACRLYASTVLNMNHLSSQTSKLKFNVIFCDLNLLCIQNIHFINPCIVFISKCCLFEHESTFISIASECYIQYNKFILNNILYLLKSIYSVMHIMLFWEFVLNLALSGLLLRSLKRWYNRHLILSVFCFTVNNKLTVISAWILLF